MTSSRGSWTDGADKVRAWGGAGPEHRRNRSRSGPRDAAPREFARRASAGAVRADEVDPAEGEHDHHQNVTSLPVLRSDVSECTRAEGGCVSCGRQSRAAGPSCDGRQACMCSVSAWDADEIDGMLGIGETYLIAVQPGLGSCRCELRLCQ